MMNNQYTKLETHGWHGKSQVDLSVIWKVFYSGLHTTLECRDTQLWATFGCIPMFLVFALKGVEPINNTSQKSWKWRNDIKTSIVKKK